MLKKLTFAFLIAGPLLLGLIGFYFLRPDAPSDAAHCAFCNPKVLDAQKFYEDDDVIALYTHKPVVPGHCLIIPKRHVERFENVTDTEGRQMMELIKKVDQAAMKVYHTSSYLLLQKNGRESGQTVPHVHFHYIPRQAGDDSTLLFLAKFLIANMKKPIADGEMKETVEKMQEAM
jgi:histidine triad (HIT) family protein